MPKPNTVVVFTAKSINRILREGGTSSWRLVPQNAKECQYAVCARNANADWVEDDEPHHMGFLVGKVRDVVPSPDYEGRYLIRFSEYAETDFPEIWKGDRNPVKYSSLEELGIDPSRLNWQKMPARAPSVPAQEANKFYSRICWNTSGWVFPTGDAKSLEKGTYVADKGFGHEEWLFNFAWVMPDGYHYAFLEPIQKSNEKHKARTLEVLVYAINPEGKRVYVGELHNCEVLKPDQIEAARKFYKKEGWLKNKIQHVHAIDGDISEFEDGEIGVNVRFRPEDAEIYSPMRLADPSDTVSRLTRYNLVLADQEVVEKQWRRRRGTTVPPPTREIHRGAQRPTTYNPMHPELQARLFKLVKDHVQDRCTVTLETEDVDLTIDYGNRKTLVEIKTCGDARSVIREALGQILEYAYYRSSEHKKVELVIVSPAPETRDSRRYIDRLRREFGIPLSYCSFCLTDELPTALKRLS